MKTKIFIVLSIIVLSSALYCLYNYRYEKSYVLYEPRRNDPTLISSRHLIRKDLLTYEHKLAFRAILEGYGFKYKMQGDNILIPKDIDDNPGLLGTLTDKAEGLRAENKKTMGLNDKSNIFLIGEIEKAKKVLRAARDMGFDIDIDSDLSLKDNNPKAKAQDRD